MAKRDRRLYLRGDTWWARIRSGGKTKRMSTGCKDYEAASIRADELEKQQADPVRHAAAKATFQDAADSLVDHARSTNKAKGTIEMYLYKAGHLLRIFGNCKLSEINPAKVESYVKKREAEGAQPHTIAKDLTTLRLILRLAKHKEQFPGDIPAIMPFQFEAKYEPRKRHLSGYEELQKLVLALPPIRAAHLCFIVATGARWSESVRAERNDIDLAKGVILLRGSKTPKSWKHVPILDILRPALEVVLRCIPEDKPGRMFPSWSSIGHSLPNACKRAGLEPVTPNDLRRTPAKWLRKFFGVEPNLIGAFLRHEDSHMAETVYATLDGEDAVDLGALIGTRTGGETPEKRAELRAALCAKFVPGEPLRLSLKHPRIAVFHGKGSNGTQGHRRSHPADRTGDHAGNDAENVTGARATVPGLNTIVRPIKPHTKPRR